MQSFCETWLFTLHALHFYMANSGTWRLHTQLRTFLSNKLIHATINNHNTCMYIKIIVEMFQSLQIKLTIKDLLPNIVIRWFVNKIDYFANFIFNLIPKFVISV